MSSQTTNLKNVSMRQSNGPKASIPDARPLGELLLALDEFNEYELHTGTGDGVQPLIADGTGTSATSFKHPPFFPVNPITFIPLALAITAAYMTFFEFPEVEISGKNIIR